MWLIHKLGFVLFKKQQPNTEKKKDVKCVKGFTVCIGN